MQPFRCAAFSDDASTAVVDDSRDGSLHYYNMTDGSEIDGARPTPTPTAVPKPKGLPSVQLTARALAISRDGKLAAVIHSSNFDRANIAEQIKLYSTATNKLLYAWTVPHLDDIKKRKHLRMAFTNALAFSPDGSLLAGSTIDDTDQLQIYLWNTRTGQRARMLSGPMYKILKTEYFDYAHRPIKRPSGLWQGITRENVDNPETSCLAFSPDGKLLFQGRENKSVAIRDVASGRTIRTIAGLRDPVRSLAVSADGKQFAVAAVVYYSGVSAGAAARAGAGVPSTPGYRSSSAAPVGRQPNVTVYATADGKLLGAWPGAGPLTFSSDGKLLAGTDPSGGNIALWELATGKLLRQFAGKSAILSANQAVRFTPDGKRIMGAVPGWPLFTWQMPTALPTR